MIRKLQVIDSHTGGEPTRTVVAGAPDLGDGSLAERRRRLAEQEDWLRTALILEPRGSDVMVGACLCPPRDTTCVTGVVFFNNVGYLGMCGHGLMGVIATLAHQGRLGVGTHRVATPVGIVAATWWGDGRVSVENVPSFRFRHAVSVLVPGAGQVRGDIAWGGNWFFLVSRHGQALELGRVENLTDYCWSIRQALAAQGITGQDGAEIDHIELIGPADDAGANARNFVLCPGKVYDRSPCGTGTSAKLACLAADGHLAAGQVWLQQSIVGSLFEGRYRWQGEQIVPTITGRAHITAESTVILDSEDPFTHGIAAATGSCGGRVTAKCHGDTVVVSTKVAAG